MAPRTQEQADEILANIKNHEDLRSTGDIIVEPMPMVVPKPVDMFHPGVNAPNTYDRNVYTPDQMAVRPPDPIKGA